MSMTTNRRSFLFGASVAGFGVLVPPANEASPAVSVRTTC